VNSYPFECSVEARISRSLPKTRVSAAVLFAIAGMSQVAHAQQQSESSSATIEEVLVSAQKRGDERLQDVPVPVSVLSADALSSNREVMLRDYFSSIPNLNANPQLAGGQGLSLRGITTGGLGAPTVGFIIDDVPFGSSISFGGSLLPDIDPGDLERIEVLRGPQGTLYGARAMGGLIKYVTKDPSTDKYSGRVELGTSVVKGGDDPGYLLRASANMPLTDTFAVRMSGFHRNDSGYIDNVMSSRKDTNEANAEGVRIAGKWQPNDVVTLKLSAAYQDTTADGSSDVSVLPGVGDLQQSFIVGAGASKRNVTAYSAALNVDLGEVDAVLLSAYNRYAFRGDWDYSANYGAAAQAQFGVNSVLRRTELTDKKFVEELRFSGSLGESFDWLVGGFYTDEEDPKITRAWAVNLQTGEKLGQIGFDPGNTGFKEYAAFSNLTYHFNQQFDVQLGGRQSWVKFEEQATSSTGVFAANQIPEGGVKDSVFTYLVTPRYRVSDDLMAYARFASGYRPGKSNRPVVIADGAPAGQDPDKAMTYELGLKGQFFDQYLTVDASAFYIDWEKIQINLFSPRAFSYGANGASAKSEGIELSAALRPLTGLTVEGWVAYTNAVLTEDFPANTTVLGREGDRLPDTAELSGYLLLEQEFPVGGSATAHFGGAASFVGERIDVYTRTPQRRILPGYTKIDLRAGLDIDDWRFNLFVNNVGDERGLIGFGEISTLTTVRTYIQPRTFGVNLTKRF